jgi:long-chain acyl-CoA synthetase
VDDAGYLYLLDRKKDMIITGGENVYSAEVENVLAAHPAVLESAVIAVPDDIWGERVHAIVVLAPDRSASEAELVAHCRRFIGGYKLPRSFEFRAALPRTSAGKIPKSVLREPYWTGRARHIH